MKQVMVRRVIGLVGLNSPFLEEIHLTLGRREPPGTRLAGGFAPADRPRELYMSKSFSLSSSERGDAVGKKCG